MEREHRAESWERNPDEGTVAMEFFVGIFVLAYGGAAVWAIIAHDLERREQMPFSATQEPASVR